MLSWLKEVGMVRVWIAAREHPGKRGSSSSNHPGKAQAEARLLHIQPYACSGLAPAACISALIFLAPASSST
jgi:hypothetical protein